MSVAWRFLARRLLRSVRGTTSVETVVVFIPVALLFFVCVQYSHMATADLVVRHATVAGARAAIVILNSDANPGGNGPPTDVVNAVALGMGPWLETDKLFDVEVTWIDRSSRSDPHGEVTVNVDSWFDCRVPLAKVIMCGIDERKNLKYSVTLPLQGARYRM